MYHTSSNYGLFNMLVINNNLINTNINVHYPYHIQISS